MSAHKRKRDERAPWSVVVGGGVTRGTRGQWEAKSGCEGEGGKEGVKGGRKGGVSVWSQKGEDGWRKGQTGERECGGLRPSPHSRGKDLTNKPGLAAQLILAAWLSLHGPYTYAPSAVKAPAAAAAASARRRPHPLQPGHTDDTPDQKTPDDADILLGRKAQGVGDAVRSEAREARRGHSCNRC